MCRKKTLTVLIRGALSLILLICLAHPLLAQSSQQSSSTESSKPATQQTPARPASSQPGNLKIGSFSISGSMRLRIESWNWFEGSAENTYSFPHYILRLALAQKFKKFDWQLEFAQPALLGLPDNAIAPGAQGQLGLGASYFVANNRRSNVGTAFPKQAFIRFNQLAGRDGFSLRFGRFEFTEGAEVAPKDGSLAWLKAQRIANRILGTFAFSAVNRSFDGVHLNLNGARTNFTLMGARTTRGVFQADGWGEMDVDVFYGALTRQFPHKSNAGELRVFVLGYHDGRLVLKTDNRPQGVRAADTGKIRIGTYGAHYIHNFNTTRNGKFDLLFWGTLQNGSWGALDHRAGAFALEAGWQPPLTKLRPWLRFAYFRGSGDTDAADGEHGTFFQVLPTPRWYARFPFFNLQNNEDISGTVLLRPHSKVVVRTEIHGLRLAERNDLWYQGGGAFQNTSFGYVGRPSGGGRDLGNLWDASVDLSLHPRFSLGFYFGAVWGGNVIRSIYPSGKNAQFGFSEFTYRF
jgi:hypothetical protein